MGQWDQGEILGFDLETTGVDRYHDVPVSFALVTVLAGRVVRRRSRIVDPGREIPEQAAAMHGITTDRARREGMPLADAVDLMADALVTSGARQAPVAGMRLDFDLTMLDVQCRATGGPGLRARGWDGPALDAWVIDRRLDRYRAGRRTLTDLYHHYRVPIDRPHEASADAEAALGVVLAMGRAFPALRWASPGQLHRLQVAWHREWFMSYSWWRERNGLSPLPPQETMWPIAVPDAPMSAVA